MAALSSIGFDADDTLWHSENHFALTEDRFRALVSPWIDETEAGDRLLQRERANLKLFGYGIKGFTLSMIETAIEASDQTIPAAAIDEIVGWGKEMLAHPVELLPDVAAVVGELSDLYQLVLITKGDLFHQESKIAESGLAHRFDHVEIMSEKSPARYQEVLDRLGVRPEAFVMVGNSVRSDIAPVLSVGGHGVHIPYEFIWGHEVMEERPPLDTWHQLAGMGDLPALLAELEAAAGSAPCQSVVVETAGE